MTSDTPESDGDGSREKTEIDWVVRLLEDARSDLERGPTRPQTIRSLARAVEAAETIAQEAEILRDALGELSGEGADDGLPGVYNANEGAKANVEEAHEEALALAKGVDDSPPAGGTISVGDTVYRMNLVPLNTGSGRDDRGE